MTKLRTWPLLLLLAGWLLWPTAAYADTTHTVQYGDTLYSISRQYDVPVGDIMAANNLTNPNLIYVGQALTIPTDGGDPAPTPTPDPGPAPDGTTHTVRPGETLASIGRQYSVSVSAIAQANNIVNVNRIYVGQRLTIPGGSGGNPSPNPTPTPNPDPTPGGGTVHIVQPGETLSRIALRYGTTISAIMAANNLSNANFIYVGQALTIPGGSGSGGPVDLSGTAFGGQTHTFAHADTMRDIGMGWVKFQHKWSPGDSPDVVAGRIADAHNRGFKVLLSMPGAQTYPPTDGIDFAAYTEFLRGVAALSDPPDAIEVWNEMNIDFEWPAGQINPSSYVNNMLAPAYNAIKGENSSIIVIAGAPAPTGFDNGTNAWADDRYVRGMAAAGGGNYMDCMGVHHNAGATSPSARSGHPAGSHYSWYYAATADVYANAFGGRVPLCFTEIGYLSGDGFGGLPDNFAWAGGTSVQEHAQWLGEALRLAANDGRVRMFIVFNVDFTLYEPNGDPQAGYALIRPDGSCPACDTLRAASGR